MGQVLAGPGSLRASLGSWPAFMKTNAFQGAVTFARPYLSAGAVIFTFDRIKRNPFKARQLLVDTAIVGSVLLGLQLLWGVLRAPAVDKAPARGPAPARRAPTGPEIIQPELPPETRPYGPEDEPEEDFQNYPNLKPIPTERPPGQGPAPEDWA